jgi:DNA (cytosine-5)-methyltransferase 1
MVEGRNGATEVTFGSLFAGIGGMDLGLERAGMECKWQVEINSFCVGVLEKHWPKANRHGDITELSGCELDPVDLIAGGFPCQDVSNAGNRAGISGTRSGLWREMVRTVCLVRPRIALVENVAGLLDRGMGRVLGDLADAGYDSEWDCVSACEFGAPHPRERVFIVAHAQSEQGWRELRWIRSTEERDSQRNIYWPSTEPGCPRMADGVPNRMDRLVALGNSVSPPVAEWIGRRILEA